MQGSSDQSATWQLDVETAGVKGTGTRSLAIAGPHVVLSALSSVEGASRAYLLRDGVRVCTMEASNSVWRVIGASG